MGYLNLAVVQKRSQLLLLVQGVIYRVLRLAVGNIRAEHDGAPAVYSADKLCPRFDNDRLSAGVKRDDGEAPEKDGQRQKQAYGFF